MLPPLSRYPITGGPIEIQTADDVAADKCLAIPPERRNVIESKTLSIVRYARRFHDIALDGFICEFLIDKTSGQGASPILHGFWSVTTYKGTQRAVPQDPDGKLKHRAAPVKAYPFPVDRQPEMLVLFISSYYFSNKKNSKLLFFIINNTSNLSSKKLLLFL